MPNMDDKTKKAEGYLMKVHEGPNDGPSCDKDEINDLVAETEQFVHGRVNHFPYLVSLTQFIISSQ